MDPNNFPFGIATDAATMIKLFEEFTKKDAKTKAEREKVMFDFFRDGGGKGKVQDVLIGEEDFNQTIKKSKSILSGEVDKDGKAVWTTYKKKDKK